MLFVTMLFTSRSVNRLVLLKGGSKIGVITDGIFGKNMVYTLNLNETSFRTIRNPQSAQVSIE